MAPLRCSSKQRQRDLHLGQDDDNTKRLDGLTSGQSFNVTLNGNLEIAHPALDSKMNVDYFDDLLVSLLSAEGTSLEVLGVNIPLPGSLSETWTFGIDLLGGGSDTVEDGAANELLDGLGGNDFMVGGAVELLGRNFIAGPDSSIVIVGVLSRRMDATIRHC
jgi:hypothetical protein